MNMNKTSACFYTYTAETIFEDWWRKKHVADDSWKSTAFGEI